MSIREEIDQWMRENFRGEFEPLRWRATPGDEGIDPGLRRKWEQKMGAAGWLGVSWPKKYGGREAALQDLVAFNEQYAIHGGPGKMGHIGETLFAPTLMAFGTEEQKAEFLPGIREGRTLWAQGYSEPNAGSDLSNIKTKARLKGDKWVIDGQKIWTSSAHEADWIFVIARAEEGSKNRNGLVFLLVPLDQPGIDIRPIKQISGTAEFNEVFFDGVRTAKKNILSGVGDGWKIAMALLGFERGASTLGQQMTFNNEFYRLVEIAKENGASKDPHIRARMAESYARMRIMRYNALRMLAAIGKGEMDATMFMSKIYWATWHRDLGELAMDIVGSDAEILKNGEYSLEQTLFLFARSDTIYAGTNQIQRNIISERVLGMPKEPRGPANG